MRRDRGPQDPGTPWRSVKPGSSPEHFARGDSSAPTVMFDDVPERFRAHLVTLKERLDVAESRILQSTQSIHLADSYRVAETKRIDRELAVELSLVWTWIYVTLSLSVFAIVCSIPAIVGLFWILFLGWGHPATR